jgi:thiamine biosynthesis lipoprotein
MGTLFRIVTHSEQHKADASAAANAAFELAEGLEDSLSDYRADSEVGRFHRSPVGEAFVLSDTLVDVLAKSDALRLATGGAFDPARGALTRLWRMSRRTETLPDNDELKSAMAASGWDQLEFAPKRRTLKRKSGRTRLDFGGIAKGYAADAMLSLMVERGFPRSSIAAGGDLRVGDPPPGKTGWVVALWPAGTKGQSSTITIRNAAVSTSGSTEQGIEVLGTRYSHIIDPSTGLGMTTVRAACVVAPTATDSDALATALCVLGAKAGLSKVEALPGCAGAVFATPGNATPSASSPAFPTLKAENTPHCGKSQEPQ